MASTGMLGVGVMVDVLVGRRVGVAVGVRVGERVGVAVRVGVMVGNFGTVGDQSGVDEAARGDGVVSMVPGGVTGGVSEPGLTLDDPTGVVEILGRVVVELPASTVIAMTVGINSVGYGVGLLRLFRSVQPVKNPTWSRTRNRILMVKVGARGFRVRL
jgi:hypothetical protein